MSDLNVIIRYNCQKILVSVVETVVLEELVDHLIDRNIIPKSSYIAVKEGMQICLNQTLSLNELAIRDMDVIDLVDHKGVG